MGQLSADRDIQTKAGIGYIKTYKAKAAENFYKGEHVSVDTSGWLVKSTDVASEFYIGLVVEKSLAVAAESSGDRLVRVHRDYVALLPATTLLQAHVGDIMEIVDSTNIDDTSSNHVKVGELLELVTSSSGWVWGGRNNR